MASFQKRGKFWRYRIYFRDKDGIEKSISKSGFRTKAETKKAALEIEVNLKMFLMNMIVIHSKIGLIIILKLGAKTKLAIVHLKLSSMLKGDY